MIEKSKIEASVQDRVDPELLALVGAEQQLLVSGMPLRIFHPTNPDEDKFFTDCTPMTEEALAGPFRVFMQRFGGSEANLPECYLPTAEEKEYPVIQGFAVDGFQVVLGIRQALGFAFKAVPTSEQ